MSGMMSRQFLTEKGARRSRPTIVKAEDGCRDSRMSLLLPVVLSRSVPKISLRLCSCLFLVHSRSVHNLCHLRPTQIDHLQRCRACMHPLSLALRWPCLFFSPCLQNYDLPVGA